MKITSTYQIQTYKGLGKKRKKEKHKESIPFHANPVKTVSAEAIISLLTAGCVSIISAANVLSNRLNKVQSPQKKMEKERMNETEKFIDIREKFSKELEPAALNSEKTCWDFFINSFRIF